MMHSSDHAGQAGRESRRRRSDSASRNNVAAVLCDWLRAITDLEEQMAIPRVMNGEVPVILHLYNLHVSSKLAYEVSIALAMMRDISRTAPVWVCVHVKVDALAALRHDVQMGSALMMSTDKCRRGLLLELQVNQVVASCASIRLWIRLTQPVIPCSDLCQLLGLGSVLFSSLSAPTLVRFVGTVHTLSTPRLQCYSRTICCASCSTIQRVGCTNSPSMLASDNDADGSCNYVERGRAAMCCACQGGEIVEDLSQRVMMPCQEVWISCLSSAICKLPFGVMQQCVRVCLVDDLVSTVHLGDVVEVLGVAAVQMQGSALEGLKTLQAGASAPIGVVEVEANNIIRVVPHTCWLSDSPDTAVMGTDRTSWQRRVCQETGVQNQHAPVPSLQLLCNLLEESLGSYIPSHLCLALLASASVVSTPDSNTGALEARTAERRMVGQQSLHLDARLGIASAGHKGARQTMNLLVGISSMDPTGSRLMQGAAALLSPHSVSLGPHMEDAILPRVAKGSGNTTSEGEPAQLVVSSVLTGANRGILFADASLMGVKEKAQLADILPRIMISLPCGASKQAPPLIPLTATVWAVASYNTSIGDSSNKRHALGGGPTPMAGARTGQGWGGMSEAGFDLLLLLPEDANAAAAYVFGAAAADSDQGASRAAARSTLRTHIARSVRMSPPLLSEPCLSLLSTYIVAVRQSMLALTQADLVGLLVKVATGFARLMLREQVTICPDCVLAVLLCEDHLACRFGDSYMGLGLPRLSPTADNTVDNQLKRVHAVLASALKGVGSTRDFAEQ